MCGLHPIKHIVVAWQITGRVPRERLKLDVSTVQIFYEWTACRPGAGGQLQADKGYTGLLHRLDAFAPARRAPISGIAGGAPSSAQPLEPCPETFRHAAGCHRRDTRGIGRL